MRDGAVAIRKTAPERQTTANIGAGFSEDPTQQGAHIKSLRQEKGLTVVKLAKAAGLSPNTVRAIERGASAHKASIHRLLDVLNTRPMFTNDKLLLGESVEIALLYQEASTPIRTFVNDILRASKQGTDRPDPLLFAMAHELDHLTTDEREAISALLQLYKQRAVRTGKTPSRRRTNADRQRR